jgi:hypothetical protein
MTGRDKDALSQARGQIKRLSALLEHGDNKRGSFGRELRDSIKRWQTTERTILQRYGTERRK